MDNNLAQGNASQSDDAGATGAGSSSDTGDLGSSLQDGGNAGDGGDAGAGGDAGDQGIVQRQQQASAAAKKAAEGPAWTDGFPEEMREKLQGFESQEDFTKAFNDGSLAPSYKTEDYSKLSLGEGADPSQPNEAMDTFKDFCVEKKISPSAAQELVQFQTGVLQKAEQAYIEQGTKDLKARWGNGFQTNLQKGLQALALLDKKMGGRFGPAVSKISPEGKRRVDDPMILEAAYEIGMMIGEANLGAGGPSGPDPNKPVTAEDTYQEIFDGK